MNKIEWVICEICRYMFIKRTRRHKYCCSECWIEGSKRDRIKKRTKNGVGYLCYLCGSNKDLHDHHIIRQVDGGKETVWLCGPHHRLIHKFMKMLTTLGYKIVKI